MLSAKRNTADGASRSEDAIEVKNLWKAFYDSNQASTVVAISDVSISIPKGQFVCICGPSGCGKSTLVRILAGLERKTLGVIDIEDGGKQSDRPPAMVFQEASLFPWLTLEENVAYPLRLQGVGAEERARSAAKLLEMTRLSDFANAYPHQLSGGMKQRASVARALIDQNSSILLMDEPFGALDEQTRIELQQELLRIWEQTGKTVLFITHSVEEALTLGDRIIVMSARPGEVVADISVPFSRPRNVLELRSQAEFGKLTFEIWQLLARYKEGVAREVPVKSEQVPVKTSSSVSHEELERLARPSRFDQFISAVGKFSPLLVLVLWEMLTWIG
ncbi:MAG: ABC transporter ATP-binding protein, partial [Xanthobacteraceae bacterium]